MVDLGDRPEGVGILRDARIEFFGFEIFGETQRHEVAPLVAAAETVDDDRILNTVAIEFPDHSTADQTGGTGDNRSARMCASVHPRAVFDGTARSASRMTACKSGRCSATRSPTVNALAIAATSSPAPTKCASGSPARTVSPTRTRTMIPGARTVAVNGRPRQLAELDRVHGRHASIARSRRGNALFPARACPRSRPASRLGPRSAR